jgi:hypothetical protein
MSCLWIRDRAVLYEIPQARKIMIIKHCTSEFWCYKVWWAPFIAIVIVLEIGIVQTIDADNSTVPTKGANLSKNGTFSAVGTISSLNFYSNNISDIAGSKKVILSGDWSINVNDGFISFFEAHFVAAPADGSVSHTHQLVNLVSNDAAIQLGVDGSTSIIGTIDVKLNGIDYWKNVDTTVRISKGSVIAITLDDPATGHHFMRQPIYGIVNRLMY